MNKLLSLCGLCFLLTTALFSQERGTVTFTATGNSPVTIPDLGYNNSSTTINNSTIGSATITNISVTYSFTHTYHGDLEISLSTTANHNGNLTLFYHENGSGQYTETVNNIAQFNGESVNQTYFLNAWDNAAYDTGSITNFSVTVSFFNAMPSLVTTPSFSSYNINTDGYSTMTVDAQDPGDNINLYITKQLTNGTQNSTQQIDWAYHVSGNVHRYIENVNFNVAGTWRWRVYAEDSFGQRTYYPSASGWSTNYVYVTNPNSPPNSFSKYLPANNANVTSSSIRLQWYSTADPNGDPVTYNVMLKDEAENTVFSQNGYTGTTTDYITIQSNVNYYWQVWALDNHGGITEANDPDWWFFRFPDLPPTAFVKSLPLDDDVIQSGNVVLSWSASTDPEGSAVTYLAVLHDAAENTIYEQDRAVTYTPSITIQQGVMYYWQVWAYDNHGNSAVADDGVWWSFNWANQPPTAFSKISPANGLTVSGTEVTLQWQQSYDPEGGLIVYDVELDTSNGENVITWPGITSTSVTYNNLTSNTPYYWYVKARDNQDNFTEADGGSGGEWWFFNTNVVNHAPTAVISSITARMTVSHPVHSGDIDLEDYLSDYPATKIHKNTLLTFTASASDPDPNQELSYEWRSNSSLISTESTFSTSLLAPGVQNITLRVYDSFDPPAYDDATFPAFEVIDVPVFRFPFDGSMYTAGPNGGLFYGEGSSHLNYGLHYDLFAIDWNGGNGGNSDRGMVVRSPFSGTVKEVQYSNTGYGFKVIISQTIGIREYQALSGHLSAISVKVGDVLLSGDEIGLLGNTGAADGAHIHQANYIVENGIMDACPPEPAIASLDYMSIIQAGSPYAYPYTSITSQNPSFNPRRLTKDSSNGLDAGYWTPLNTYSNASEPDGYGGSYKYYTNQIGGTGASWSFSVSAYEPTVCVPEVYIPAMSTSGCPSVRYTTTINGMNPVDTVISHAIPNISGCPHTGKWVQLSPVLINSNATITVKVSNFSTGYTDKKIIVDAARIISKSADEVTGGGMGLDYSLNTDSLEFGSCLLNEYLVDNLLIVNIGSIPLQILGSVSDNMSFYANIDAALATLEEGDTLAIPITFSPLECGVSEGNITLRINDTDLVIHCSGTGMANTGFMPVSISFSGSLGLNYTKNVALHNQSGSLMTVTGISFDNSNLEFEGIETGDIIAGGSNLDFTIMYTAMEVCDLLDSLTIFTNTGTYHLPIHISCTQAGESTPLVDKIRLSANYILACQYNAADDTGTPDWLADGCINDIYPAPDINGIQHFDWVVPRENAMAILGLELAFEKTADLAYREAAGRAIMYLANIQDAADGAWYNQYDKCTPHNDLDKSPTQTAEVMLAYYKYGYIPSLYQSMQRGADYLLSCANVTNKTGNDDGLVCGGKNFSGSYYTDRWTSDNSYAYQALRAAEKWALIQGDANRALNLNRAAGQIITGIENYLLDPVNSFFYRRINAIGNPDNSVTDWINYSPVMLDLPLFESNNQYAGQWIHNNLQGADGAVRWNTVSDYEKRSPGFSFQAGLVWSDLEQVDYYAASEDWVYGSGLWKTMFDSNGVIGGWVDWKTTTNQANWWERFIDTEFYWMAYLNSGYDFSSNSIKEIRNNSPVSFGNHVINVPVQVEFQLENLGAEALSCHLVSLTPWLQIASGSDLSVPAGDTVHVVCNLNSSSIGLDIGIVQITCGQDTTYSYFIAGFVEQDKPESPQNLSLTVSGGSVQLSWEPVTQTVCGGFCEISVYKVYSSTDPDALFPAEWDYLGETSSTSFNAGTILTKRFYRVTAISSSGVGP